MHGENLKLDKEINSTVFNIVYLVVVDVIIIISAVAVVLESCLLSLREDVDGLYCTVLYCIVLGSIKTTQNFKEYTTTFYNPPQNI